MIELYELVAELMYEDEFLEYHEALTIAERQLNIVKEVSCG